MSLGKLIQINMELDAAHTIAYFMDRRDIADYEKNAMASLDYEIQMEHMLLGWDAINLDIDNIQMEANRIYNLCKEPKTKLSLVK